MGLESALFGLLALVAVFAAAGMILSKNAIHSALFLILNFGCVALLFLMLDAAFISMVQIAVYAGAIMVLFLFVIMLLGAEQAAETDTRKLTWVAYAGWVLPLILIFALGGTLLVFRLQLPEPSGNTPHLRIIQAANVADPVTVTVAGADSEQSIEGLSFAGVSEFMELEAADYVLTITDVDGLSVYSGTVTLAEDDVITLIAHGETTVETTVIHNSFETTGDNEARLIFLNLFTEQPLSLVDIGRDRVLNVDSSNVITDHVLFAELPYGEVIVPEDAFREDSYEWGFYSQKPDTTWYRVAPLAVPEYGYWAVDGNTEQTIVLVRDYAGPEDPVFGHVPRVLDSPQEELLIQTNEPFGAPGDIGRELFVAYLLPVNLVGFLLLVALVGVIVLTRPQGVTAPRRSTINRRRKVSRPLVSVISQQTGRDVVEDTLMLDEPGSGD
jgi:NADH-quinone oxidoreductase subunit J